MLFSSLHHSGFDTSGSGCSSFGNRAPGARDRHLVTGNRLAVLSEDAEEGVVETLRLALLVMRNQLVVWLLARILGRHLDATDVVCK